MLGIAHPSAAFLSGVLLYYEGFPCTFSPVTVCPGRVSVVVWPGSVTVVVWPGRVTVVVWPGRVTVVVSPGSVTAKRHAVGVVRRVVLAAGSNSEVSSLPRCCHVSMHAACRHAFFSLQASPVVVSPGRVTVSAEAGNSWL